MKNLILILLVSSCNGHWVSDETQRLMDAETREIALKECKSLYAIEYKGINLGNALYKHLYDTCHKDSKLKTHDAEISCGLLTEFENNYGAY